MKQYWMPGLVFLAQITLLALFLWLVGGIHPHRVPDTRSYERFPWHSVAAALEHSRTVGYPLFLAGVRTVFDSPHAIPWCQLGLHAAGVAIFWAGVGCVIPSPWISMLVASSLLYSNVALRYVGTLTPDALASSVSIAAVGALLAAIWKGGWWRWFAVAGLVFTAYQLRPVYLFLVPLLPLLGAMLVWATPRTRRGRRRPLVVGGQLAGLLVLPLVVFCGLKGLVAGEYSLVSFGGNNLAGVVTAWMDEEVARRLPQEVQPLASEILRRRSHAERRSSTQLPTRSYSEIEGAFDRLTWEVSVPAARAIHGDAWPDINHALTRLSLAVVEAAPGHYATWLAKAFVRAVYMVVSELIVNPIYFVLLWTLLVVHVVLALIRHRTRGESPGHGTGDTARGQNDRDGSAPPREWQFDTLWLLALAFALAKVATVILTTPPLGRFTDPAGVFFATVLAWATINRIERLLQVASRSGEAASPKFNTGNRTGYSG